MRRYFPHAPSSAQLNLCNGDRGKKQERTQATAAVAAATMKIDRNAAATLSMYMYVARSKVASRDEAVVEPDWKRSGAGGKKIN
jgi:hypothetical protein